MIKKTHWQDEQTWPNLAQAARLIDMDRSSLSRQASKGAIAHVRRGLGSKKTSLVPPRELLRIAREVGRVPLDEVKRRMAREAARHIEVDEKALLRELDQVDAGEVAADPEQVSPSGGRAKEIDLGRIRPGVTSEREVVSASTVAALDETRSMQKNFHAGERRAREVNLGRLRPGFRFY